MSNHKYLHNTELKEDTYAKCKCTFAALANQILGNLQDENVELQAKKVVNVKPDETHPPQLDTDEEKLFVDKVETFLNSNSSSLLKKYLNINLVKELHFMKTVPYGSSLHDVIRTGLANPDSAVGIYAPDPDTYRVFRKLFFPIITDYHNLPDVTQHPASNWGNVAQIGSFPGSQVISTRIRIARSLKGYPFNSKMSEVELLSLERAVSRVLMKELKGDYLPLQEMSPTQKQDLIDQHLLFEDCDRFLLGAGGCGSWPKGRGIFLRQDV